MKKIEKVFADGEVPVCFSANSDFAPYTAVMIRSILDHADKNKNYDIIVLYTELEESFQKALISLSTGYSNVSIRTFDVSNYINGFEFFTGSIYTKSKYSKEVYFRLLIPTLMPNYDKVIYLDGDMITFDDISGLMQYEISEYLIAACRDYAGTAHCYTEGDDRKAYRSGELGIQNIDNYIISGTLVFNIPEFNKRFNAYTLMQISASRIWRQHDQDVLNKICEGDIYILGGEWNYLFGNTLIKNLPPHLYSEYIESEKNVKIVHFAGERKPTRSKPVKFSEEFWSIAERTPFFDILNEK